MALQKGSVELETKPALVARWHHDAAMELASKDPWTYADQIRVRGMLASMQGILTAALRPAVDAEAAFAVLRFDRSPGHENDMPQVVSSNWLPDGEYPVYLSPPQSAPAVQEVTDAMVERAIASLGADSNVTTHLAMRAVLTAALQGEQ